MRSLDDIRNPPSSSAPAPDAETLTLLEGAATAVGPTALAILRRSGDDPEVAWTPGLAGEPAFLAYSLTKTVLALLVLQLRDEGRLELDEDLGRLVPRHGLPRGLTLRRLLRHEAGVPDYGGLPHYHEAVRDHEAPPWDAERFLAETLDRGLLFEPGSGWAYSNAGYLLLKLAVQRAADRSLREVVQERVAGPLGLARTRVAETRGDLEGLAAGPSASLGPRSGPAPDLRTHYHPGWVSHGVVASTASEMVRFLDELMRGGLLPPRSLREMKQAVAVPAAAVDADAPWGRPSYGLGLMVDPQSRWGLLLGHEGAGPGHQASAFHAPGLGLTACAMGGLEDWAPREAVFAALDAGRS